MKKMIQVALCVGALALMSALCRTAAASVSRVAVSTGYVASGNCTVTLTSSTHAGDLMVVSIAVHDTSTSVTVSGVTDSASHSYTAAWTRAHVGTSSHYFTTALFYYANLSAGVTSVTVPNPSGGGGMAVIATEYSGVATTSPLDQNSPCSTTAASPYASGSVTTTQANELLVGFTLDTSATGITFTGSSGWSAVTTAGITNQVATIGQQERIVSSTGSYQNTGSTSSGTDYAGIATFKAINPSDATLSNLTISSGTLTPTFASATTSYTDSVANSVTSVTVTPTATRAAAQQSQSTALLLLQAQPPAPYH